MTFTAILTLPEQDARRLADGLSEDDAFSTSVVDAIELPGGNWQLTVYFAAHPTAEETQRLKSIAGEILGAESAEISIAELPETDWVAKSLEGLRPVRAGRFLVHGSHDRAARRNNLVNIEIEAGLAFGSGHHGTTAGCLAAIDRLAQGRRFRNVLDLGTGSGVLAIAMAKTWRLPVLASDIDPVATRVAAENSRANGVGGLVETVTAAGFRHPAFLRRRPFDLIVANILASPLANLSRDFAAHLAPGGVAVLSGLLPDQRARIVAAYRDKGLQLSRWNVRDGWLTLVLAG